jgi:hypothetical protein
MKKIVLFVLIALSTYSFCFADKSWDFMNWSETSLKNLATDTLVNWTYDWTTQTRYSNKAAIVADAAVLANGVEITELQGITFGALTAGKLRIDFTTPGRLMLNGTSLTLNVPGCLVGDTLTAYTKTGNNSNKRGITASGATRIAGDELSLDSVYNVFIVSTAGVVSLTTTAGLHFRSITLVNPKSSSTALNAATTGATVVKTEFYTLSGILISLSQGDLPKGVYIQKSSYSNGAVVNTKVVKAFE